MITTDLSGLTSPISIKSNPLALWLAGFILCLYKLTSRQGRGGYVHPLHILPVLCFVLLYSLPGGLGGSLSSLVLVDLVDVVVPLSSLFTVSLFVDF